jgi:hypothetical protein
MADQGFHILKMAFIGGLITIASSALILIPEGERLNEW